MPGTLDRYAFWNDHPVPGDMDGCRICGRLTGGGAPPFPAAPPQAAPGTARLVGGPLLALAGSGVVLVALLALALGFWLA